MGVPLTTPHLRLARSAERIADENTVVMIHTYAVTHTDTVELAPEDVR